MPDNQLQIKDITKITYFFDDTASNRFRPIIFDVNEGLLSKAYWQDKPSEIVYLAGDGEQGIGNVNNFIEKIGNVRFTIVAGKDIWMQRGGEFIKNDDPSIKGFISVNFCWQKSDNCGGIQVMINA